MSTATGDAAVVLTREMPANARPSARKILGIFLVALALGSCRQPSPEPVTLTYLSRGWSQPDELPRAQYLSRQFTRETGIGVKHPPVPETTLGQLDLSRRLLQGGRSGPDVLGIDVIWPGILEDYLLDLRPYFPAEISSLDPEILASYTVGGKVVAIPYQAQVGVLEYRTDLLRQYGYDHPPKTWSELERMAARIQAGERAKGRKDFWGYLWEGAATEGLTCNGLEWQVAEGGGRIIESDKTISVNNPAAIRAWQRARRWIGWISPPSVVAYRELDSMNLFDSGGAAFRRTWQWNYRLTHFRKSVQADKTGYVSIPGGPGGRAGTLGGTGLAISRYSVNRQEAIDFVRFLIRTEHQSSEEGARIQLPAHLEDSDLPLVLDLYAHSGKPNQKRSGVVSRPSNLVGHSYVEVTRAYIGAVHSVLTGQSGAAEAAAELEKQLIKITGFKTGLPKNSKAEEFKETPR